MGVGKDTSELRSVQRSATLEAERRLAWVRVCVMASGSLLFPVVSDRPGVVPWLGYALLATGWLYTLAVLAFEPYRRFPVLLSTTFSAVTDSVMTLLWLAATGGIDSPWAIALYGFIVALSFRYEPRYAALGTLLCSAGYVAMSALMGQLRGHGVEVAVHVTYFFLIAGTGAYIGHERHHQLASRMRLLAMAQDVAQVGSWEWSIASGELRWSESLCRIMGVPLDVKPTYDLYMAAIAPGDRELVSFIIEKAVADLQPFRFDHRIVRPDGTTRWLHCRGRVIVGSDGSAAEMIGSAQDVTERREMQSQLVLTSKLASLGTLASGIAHEINNPLAYVSNNLEILERHLDAIDPGGRDELRQAVIAARHGSTRVRDIVRGLRTFSRAEDDSRAPVDVAAVADLAIAMVSHELSARARVVREYEVTPRVEANESRLSQVFVNLLVNAAHAIEPGCLDDNEIRVRVRPLEDGRVAIEVSDTGSGISDEHLPRIFDPFFTTKPIGVGNGLGLSICHGIVADLGGEIAVQTSPSGTTFRVLLPASRARSTPARDDASDVPPTDGTRRRVLVVDDEARYASSLRMLLDTDYETTVCSGGRAALDRLGSGEPFDVILCDLMMPGMTGMELHAELEARGLDPRRVVFLTGGPTNDAARLFLERPDVRHLVKPVDYGELQRAIETVAAAGSAAA